MFYCLRVKLIERLLTNENVPTMIQSADTLEEKQILNIILKLLPEV